MKVILSLQQKCCAVCKLNTSGSLVPCIYSRLVAEKWESVRYCLFVTDLLTHLFSDNYWWGGGDCCRRDDQGGLGRTIKSDTRE